MNKLVTTALAVAAAGSLSHADPGDNDWLELDGEINDLATALTPAQDGMGWSALIRANFLYSSDEVATGSPGNPDLAGFAFADVDLAFWGSVGNFGWRVSTDILPNEGSLLGVGGNNVDGGSPFVLEDAYVYWDCTQQVTLTLGNQKPMGLRSGHIYPENQLFIDRTALGSTFDYWDNGLTAAGSWEDFDYAVQVFNGSENDLTGGSNFSAASKNHIWLLHAAWNLGDGAGAVEGASAGNDDLNLTVGFTYVSDDTTAGDPISTRTGDGNMLAVDINGSINQFGFGAEIADLDDDGSRNVSRDFGSGQLGGGLPVPVGFANNGALFTDDSTPWNLTGSFLLSPEWEIGARYEDIDDFSNTSILSVGVSWYRSGSNAKLQAQWQSWDSDATSLDGDVYTIGMVVGASS